MVVGLLPPDGGGAHAGGAHADSGGEPARRSGSERIWLAGLLTERDGLVLLAEGDVLRRSAEVLTFWEDQLESGNASSSTLEQEHDEAPQPSYAVARVHVYTPDALLGF